MDIDAARREAETPVEATPADAEEVAATLADPGGSPYDQAAQKELRQRVEAALRELPEEFRVAIYLADIEGYPYREIAEMMGTPMGTVMSRLHRGRAKLRAKLAGHAPQQRPLVTASP